MTSSKPHEVKRSAGEGRLRRAAAVVARWTDLPTAVAEPSARANVRDRSPGGLRAGHVALLLAVMLTGGLPVLRAWSADVSRVAASQRHGPQAAGARPTTERPANARSPRPPGQVLPVTSGAATTQSRPLVASPGGVLRRTRLRRPAGTPARIPSRGRTPVPRRSVVADVASWADRVGVPVSAATAHARISSPFGPRVHPVWGDVRTHAGVDFAAPRGAPVAATASGVVVAAGRLGGYGLRVDVRHPASGLTTRYAHLERLGARIRVGAGLQRGALVGFVGSSGVATGPHLHYEVRGPSGTALDPAVLAARYRAAWLQAARVAPRVEPGVARAGGTRLTPTATRSHHSVRRRAAR